VKCGGVPFEFAEETLAAPLEGGVDEVFLEEMVEQVFQAGRNAMIVFSADDRKAVRSPVDLRHLLKDSRGGAAPVFLVHTVEQRRSAASMMLVVCPRR